MGKNILITAGGTSEPVDRVRSITNTGTGKLGSLIAKELSQYEEVENIFYVHGSRAVMPDCPKITAVPIVTTQDLDIAVTGICVKNRIDAVIHSMAVSDFRVRFVLDAETVYKLSKEADNISALMSAGAGKSLTRNENKISSKTNDPVIFLEKTPKILPIFRQLLPDALIIGFKLLDGVTHKQLIDTAFKLLENNGCSYVLANDYRTVEAGNHTGYLLDSEHREICFYGKENIAAGIAKAVMNSEVQQ